MSSEMNAASRLKNLIEDFWVVQAINAAIELRIPEALGDAGANAAEIAAKTGAPADGVFRLLRALAAVGVCNQSGDTQFELTPMGRLLRADAPHSMRSRAQFAGGMQWRAFGDLPTVVKTGSLGPSIVGGREGFTVMGEQADALLAFQQTMAETSRAVGGEIAKAYDFSRFETVMDVGGGYGALLAAFLQTNPKLQAVVFDLPYLETASNDYRKRLGVGERSRFVGGDFFESVPALADCYVLKYIVHDWNDAQAIAILRNCRAAAGAQGTLILVEAVVPERVRDAAEDRNVVRADLLMMAFGGKERTAAEYGALLAEAGWRMTRIVPTGTNCSVIEAQVN